MQKLTERISSVRGRSWIEERSPDESLAILRDLSQVCSDRGGDLAKRLNTVVQTVTLNPDCKSLQYLLDFEISYETLPVHDAIYSRQILGFFQKSSFLRYSASRSTEEAAADRFMESERMCLDTNRRFAYANRKPDSIGPVVASVLHRAARKISAVLGDVPSLDKLPFAFGPGANTNIKSAVANPRVKLSAPLECSSNLSPTVAEFLSETPAWMALHDLRLKEDSFIVDVSVVPGKVMFVPKNAKTDRSIVIEPLLNSFFQKGVGSFIRDRLQRFGVDLRDQSRNQRLARLGSVDGSLATIDLSMASDCLSRELVWSLLPYDWAVLLDQLRSGDVILPASCFDSEMLKKHSMEAYVSNDRPYTLQKFSSMGNGFTFELESLIFYGIASSCAELHRDGAPQDVAVYGDDIIVPVDCAETLREVLTFCGFRLNSQKSFASGPFRESCGADYLDGFDIRPFYQKTLISDRTLFTMHNWFVRHSEPELAERVKSFINPDNLLYGPDGFGDGHLIGSYHVHRNRKVNRLGWEGGYFSTFTLRPRAFTKPMPGDAVLPVYSVYTRSGKQSPTDPNVVRGSRGYAKISIYTLERNVFSRNA